MLMDEPFGAVDPITRERLQDEFLNIQQNIKKTIVFVTHDIDEAIKMGDKIAILKQGGFLAQYDTPENILSNPNSEFVASFVGNDRILKRLSLSKVGDMDLEPANGGAGDLPPHKREPDRQGRALRADRVRTQRGRRGGRRREEAADRRHRGALPRRGRSRG